MMIMHPLLPYFICLSAAKSMSNGALSFSKNKKRKYNMATDPRKILVTCALPYANGSIHLGHMLEHIQADVWVRYQRLRGNTVNFICADDAHGTPIMLKAQQLGINPEDMIAEVQKNMSKISQALTSALITTIALIVMKTANWRQ